MKELLEKYNKCLDDKKPHTTHKIKYIKNYVTNWLYVLGNASFTTSISFIDCMCNAGIYKDGDFCTSIEVLKLFMQSAAIHKTKTFNLYLNDIDEKRIVVLNEVINKIYTKKLPNLNIFISSMDVNEYIEKLSNDTASFSYPKSTLLYVDPYDFGTVRIPILKHFCEKYYCELLFNLFTSDWVRNRNNEFDKRIDMVIDNPQVQINNKAELVEYIVSQLKVGRMKFSFNYAFHNETNAEIYQIIYFTPKEDGLIKLKDAIWDTFNGAAYYRNPHKRDIGQLSFLTPEMEEQLANSDEEYIIKCNLEIAKKIIQKLPNKTRLSYNDIAIPVLEGTMFKKGQLIKHVFQPLCDEKIIKKRNEVANRSNYTNDFYDIIG